MKITDWFGAYDNGWKGLITDESFAHPAKFSRGLIFRIVEYLLKSEMVKPGDTVIDPFGGVALGGLPCLLNGLNWIGNELEEKFVELGRKNIDLWNSKFANMPKWTGQAVLLQGDSRKLAEVIQQAGGLVSSPPFVSSLSSGKFSEEAIEELRQNGHKPGPAGNAASYGTTPGQLASLPEGKPVVVASPPYAGGLSKDKTYADSEKLSNDHSRDIIQQKTSAGGGNFYGSTSGQLGAMPEGKPGQFPAQVVVASPPYAGDSGKSDRTGHERALRRAEEKGFRQGLGCFKTSEAYGSTEGQLGAMPEGSAVVSSPPFAGNSGGRGEASRNGIDPALFDRHQGAMVGGIGSAGNLAGLKPGQFPAQGDVALVTSPPYEQAISSGRVSNTIAENLQRSGHKPGPAGEGASYGTADGQLGTESGETFWSAAAVIVSQCYQLLPPGAPAVWVVKSFVRDGAIVDFPGQWQQLCESCGFETVEVIRAWLVKDKGTQVSLEGEQVRKITAKKSFFRRLAEKNGSPAIDFETVLITRKVSQ